MPWYDPSNGGTEKKVGKQEEPPLPPHSRAAFLSCPLLFSAKKQAGEGVTPPPAKNSINQFPFKGHAPAFMASFTSACRPCFLENRRAAGEAMKMEE